jgi:RNA polymerase subunit RPABC4/transcription elongation factor Spt4
MAEEERACISCPNIYSGELSCPECGEPGEPLEDGED